MMKVLHNRKEIDDSTASLLKRGLTPHEDTPKNWDLLQIAEILEHTPKSAAILDMGASHSAVLGLLVRQGFSNGVGIDLHFTLKDRVAFWIRTIQNHFRRPYTLVSGDLTRTKFRDQSFDVIICQSVIEHGVDETAFFRECARLLKDNGTLFVSTDYWPEKAETPSGTPAFNLPWKIYSADEIRTLHAIAVREGFLIDDDALTLEAETPQVFWQGKAYTFIALTYKKRHTPKQGT
jgi:SAM-dependent methyltransferase